MKKIKMQMKNKTKIFWINKNKRLFPNRKTRKRG